MILDGNSDEGGEDKDDGNEAKEDTLRDLRAPKGKLQNYVILTCVVH